jgi:hypothetical protein
LLGQIDMTTSTIAQGSRSAARRYCYQNQDSDMTFTEALAEYYAANAGRVLRPSDLSEESAELFRSHDMCHVIFGLDTTFADEAMVDTRTLLSCDVGVRKYVRYLMTNPEAKAIFKEVGLAKIHLDNDSRHSPGSSGNLGGLEDAEEMALDAAAGIPKTHAV